MKTMTEILARIYQNSQNNPDKKFTILFRYMLRPDIYYMAYQKLYANNGTSTPEVDKNDTADGFSETKIHNINEALKSGKYYHKPTAEFISTKETVRNGHWGY